MIADKTGVTVAGSYLVKAFVAKASIMRGNIGNNSPL
jgi:hypothetical protein